MPLPELIQSRVSSYLDYEDIDVDEPLVDRTPRTIQRWTDKIAERCRDESGDPGWSFLAPHDLRRTWATLLVEAGVEPGMIMEWGGWKDWETFRDHYLGAYSPDMERRQASLVPWLDAEAEDAVKTDPNAYRGISQSPF